MASDYDASERWSNLPKEMTVKRKRKNSEVQNEQVGKLLGRDGYFILGWSTLPDELLDMISKKIDFVSFFALCGVCKNWRKLYGNHRGDFMASQAAPLVILRSPQSRKDCFFFSISEGKGYKTLLPNHWRDSSTGFWKSFVGFSSGYFISQGSLSWTKLWLINPFTRKELHIPESPCHVLSLYDDRHRMLRFDHAILAFVVNSEDFVVLGISLRLSSLFIYQSRKSSWSVYKSGGDSLQVTDVAVFGHTVYAVTRSGSIGILRLNSPGIKFLKLNNAPRISSSLS
ncbi:hypothetical protein L6164_000113 [Bauhinia variegata]|uniref:Uncharacterized protein n=1 Tax=Bauhinia variegata TaxID=167791 RepID=A0ACB9Q5L9_BAUVA|nr:hypothetical protein L6164_000113 [Bauhinia variegata]